MRSSGAPEMVLRKRLAPVPGVAEAHDPRAGPRGLSEEAQAFVTCVLEGLLALLVVGAPSVAQLPAAHRSALAGAVLLLGGEREP